MAEFFAMGGYALYVWPCYILSFVILISLGRHHGRQVKKLRDEVTLSRTEHTADKD